MLNTSYFIMKLKSNLREMDRLATSAVDSCRYCRSSQSKIWASLRAITCCALLSSIFMW